jgi:Zn-dependent M16 (insulinase) family peptidase
MYLHREIREKGGAYGGYAIYDFEDGIFFLSSYRDPHIITTLNAYDGVFAFLRSGGFDETDIKEAILQACSEIDRPDSPGTSGQKAFFRKIIGLSDDERQRFKEGVLAVNVKKVIDVSEKYFDTEQNKRSVAIISGESQLKEANEKLDKRLSIYNI